MLARIVAAVFIAVSALVAGGVTTQAGAEPRGRGWSRGRSRGRSRHWRPQYHDYNPLPEIFGGIIGGWLGSQMRPDPKPEPSSPFVPEEGEEDERPE